VWLERLYYTQPHQDYPDVESSLQQRQELMVLADVVGICLPSLVARLVS